MAIFIVSNDANSQGDLFNERMKDLVHALGYEVIRTNIHKPGREIDIVAKHPLEGRRAIVECKAKKEKIGGGDINKFIGALDAERGPEEQVSGYFASISGFTDSAFEQEQATGRRRASLLGPQEIVEQLVKNRVIVPMSTATFKAGTLTGIPSQWTIDSECDIVAHASGWLWVVYFVAGGARQAFTLVHADGDFPAEVIATDAATRLHEKENLSIPYQAGAPAPKAFNIDSARNAYYEHLLQEYGNFTLEGFPVDQYAGSKSINLEDLYIPQMLEEVNDEEDISEFEESENYSRKDRIKLSKALSSNKAIAILGVPGAGKTTLIKRLATGYADPARLSLVDDSLPSAEWVPLVVRCRDIQDASRTIVEILRDIPKRAEMPQYTRSFDPLIDASLRDGKALILIDGLDEFPVAADRARFLQRLRTFMSTYPLCTIIITSREAGFREVSGFVSERFKRYRISDLSNQEIQTLTVAWHAQVHGKTQQSIARASSLAEQIISKDRVRRLAVNPLLLTTLLLVQRWIGDLPRKRSVLYEKAIELLLMTWNVEGFEPIDLDEAKPHLAFLAHSMTVSGKQDICQEEMLQIFADARATLPEVLGYCELSPRDLLRRIELRSSLVTLVGHEVYNGTLQPTYEFKHLTFQEYLTAMALVSGWHENAVENYDPISYMASMISDSRWHEIISLFGVLSGRKGSKVVALILDQTNEAIDAYLAAPEGNDQVEQELLWNLTDLLYKCLEDEVQVSPDLADKALETLIEWSLDDSDGYVGIITSRYGSQLLKKAGEYVLAPEEPYNSSYVGVLGRALLVNFVETGSEPQMLAESIQQKLVSNDPIERVASLNVIMDFAYNLSQGMDLEIQYGIQGIDGLEICRKSYAGVLSNIEHPNPVVQFSALWAVAWSAHHFAPSKRQQVNLLPTLASLLLGPPKGAINSFAGWVIADALINLGALDMSKFGDTEKVALRKYLEDEDTKGWHTHDVRGAVVLASLSADTELHSLVSRLLNEDPLKRHPKFHRRVLSYMKRTGKYVAT